MEPPPPHDPGISAWPLGPTHWQIQQWEDERADAERRANPYAGMGATSQAFPAPVAPPAEPRSAPPEPRAAPVEPRPAPPRPPMPPRRPLAAEATRSAYAAYPEPLTDSFSWIQLVVVVVLAFVLPVVLVSPYSHWLAAYVDAMNGDGVPSWTELALSFTAIPVVLGAWLAGPVAAVGSLVPGASFPHRVLGWIGAWLFGFVAVTQIIS